MAVPVAVQPPGRARREWTVDEVLALGGPAARGRRYQLVDGELLVSASPFAPHQRMVMRLGLLLAPYVESHGLGEAFCVDADISLDARSVVKPDVLVVPPDQPLRDRWDAVKRLLLAVEVISQSSLRADRVVKRRHYQRHRVGEYWIVDLDARVVEVWGPDDERPAVIDDRLVWRPRLDGWVPEVPPFELDLAPLFERVLGPYTEPTAE